MSKPVMKFPGSNSIAVATASLLFATTCVIAQDRRDERQQQRQEQRQEQREQRGFQPPPGKSGGFGAQSNSSAQQQQQQPAPQQPRPNELQHNGAGNRVFGPG